MRYTPIHQSKEKRGKSKDIVIVTLPSMVKKGSFIDPDILLGSTQYTNEDVERYFLTELNLKQLPYHYASEQVKGDFPIYMGENQISPSSYLHDLADQNIIPYGYRNAILICVYENFSIDIPNERLFKNLSSRILSRFMRELNIGVSRIKFIDEIVNWMEVDYLDKRNQLSYPLKKSHLFNRVVFDNILKGYRIT